MMVVSYFTEEYAGEAPAFEACCEAVGQQYLAVPLKSKKSWRRNCGMKAEFIRASLNQFEQPVLWVDIDGRFRLPWDLELEDNTDFAAWFIPTAVMHNNTRPHGPGGTCDGIAAGTLWFGNTDASRAFLDAWVEAEEDGHKYPWEQKVLGELWYDKPVPALRTTRLHQRYCRVIDAKWYDSKCAPVIEHTQASRYLKYKVHGLKRSRARKPIP